MTRSKQSQYAPVDASPVKSFFVHMLTRDISLEDAILDLLDNCVDGILRCHGAQSARPYQGFYAEIEFKKDLFSISDNCGGIPWSLHDYAFRMGRPKNRRQDTPSGVGIYGIGMKRAIFKIGADCLISTQNGDNRYEVEFKPEWIGNETEWQVPVRAASRSMPQDGTTIVVGELYEGISKRFGDDAKSFYTQLERMIATNYAYIIEKGFEVKLNGHPVEPLPTRLVFAKKAKTGIQPFIFKTKAEGVEVFLAVGFTRPIPSPNEIANEQDESRYSSLDAGWTIVCNDRAVLYCDRTELTGWGEAGVPRYHTQFIAISGIVEFKAKNDPSKLPTNTTKRGIDASSSLYLQVKNKMREGMRLFTDYTNKWKLRPEESRRQIEEAGKPLSFQEVKSQSNHLAFSSTKRTVPEGSQYKPTLPMPKRSEPQTRRISFVKKVSDIEKVAEYLFDDVDTDASKVGEKCFDLILKDAR